MKATNRTPAPAAPTWARCLGLLALLALLTPAASAQVPQGTVVEEVFIHGLRTTPADQIKALLKTQRGREYSPVVVQEDFNKLAQSRLIKPREVKEQKTATGVIVHFIVEEFPNIVQEVVYKNAHHLRLEELEGITGVRKGMPLNPALNQRACFDIQEHYKKQGRIFSSVKLEEGGKPGDGRVVFNVTESPAVKVRNIRFEGNAELASGPRLATQVDTGGAFLGVVTLTSSTFNPAMLENDLFKISEYYKNNGYRDVLVSRDLTFSDDLKFVDVVFHVSEGVRYRVQDVTINGTKTLTRDEVASILKMKKGDVYNEYTAEADVRNIVDYYGHRSLKAVVDKKLTVPENDPGLVRVNYQVMEPQMPAKVGEIEIRGNDVTKSRVILRVLQLYPGQDLSYPLLRQASNDLKRLGIFETNQETGTQPTVEVEESDNEFKKVVVSIKEMATGSVMFGVGVNSSAGLVGSIVLNEKNFDIMRPPTSLADLFSGRAWRGGGQEFRAEAVPGTQLQRYSLSFREPFLFDRPISFSASAYYFDRIYNEYEERRTGARFSLGHQIDRFWSITGSIRAENVHIANVSPFAPPVLLDTQGDHFLVGPRVTVTRDDRDSFIKPTEGGIVEGSVEYVTGGYNFPVVNMEATRYFTLFQRPDGSGRHVLMARSQVSWAGNDAPPFERFYAGGFNSMRGFAFRGVGPQVANYPGFFVGGDFMFLNSLEYQMPIKANDQLYMVAFLDSGTVESNISLRDYRVAAGIGARIIVPMLGPVPIALDFGFPITRGPNDRTQLFTFSVGVFR